MLDNPPRSHKLHALETIGSFSWRSICSGERGNSSTVAPIVKSKAECVTDMQLT